MRFRTPCRRMFARSIGGPGSCRIHPTTRKVAPKMEIISAMMITIPNMKMNLRLRRCRSIRSLSPAGSRISIEPHFPGQAAGQLGRANAPPGGSECRSTRCEIQPRPRSQLVPRDFFGAMCQTTLRPRAGHGSMGSVSPRVNFSPGRRHGRGFCFLVRLRTPCGSFSLLLALMLVAH